MRWLLRCLLLAPVACSTTGARGWLDAHLDGAAWGHALAVQTQRPEQLGLELALLEATAALATQDHRLQEEATENQTITEGSTNNGDGTAVGLTALAFGMSAGDWIGGDHGESVEVLLESFAVTEGLTGLLKGAVGRQRPNQSGHSSFPSGHTSYSFAMATFLQRRVADAFGPDYAPLGYLAYLPAAYVGINRVESNHHWPSDVAFGAFLGLFVTNIVYDAHYGDAGQPGIFSGRGLRLEPEVGPDGGGLSMVLRF